MNLHILPDSKFSQVFYENIRELELLDSNRFVVRSTEKKLRFVTADIPFAKAASAAFDKIIGDTLQYDKVFLHNFSPVLYRWVATHSFRELNWMVWGADLYNLSFVKFEFLEKETKTIRHFTLDFSNWLYELKIRLTNSSYKESAYSKVKRVLTWMKGEYDFAIRNIPALNASYEMFFYENQTPYEKLYFVPGERKTGEALTFIVGNSGYAVNNHLDAISTLKRSGNNMRIKVPVSYGDAAYISMLKKACSKRWGSTVEFIDTYMSGDDYINFLRQSDGLIMNTIRPQGYGNIFMMMALGKPVYFNPKNVSLSDLQRLGLTPLSLDDIGKHIPRERLHLEADTVRSWFSHQNLVDLYAELFI